MVVTDDSSLYPAVLAELWPDAAHQLCVFHVIKDINELILDAVRRLRAAMSRRGQGRAQEEAGPQKQQGQSRCRPPRADAEGEGVLCLQASYLIVKRRENLSESERDDLRQMLEYLPELETLRRFADRIYWLFDTPKDFHQELPPG